MNAFDLITGYKKPTLNSKICFCEKKNKSSQHHAHVISLCTTEQQQVPVSSSVECRPKNCADFQAFPADSPGVSVLREQQKAAHTRGGVIIYWFTIFFQLQPCLKNHREEKVLENSSPPRFVQIVTRTFNQEMRERTAKDCSCCCIKLKFSQSFGKDPPDSIRTHGPLLSLPSPPSPQLALLCVCSHISFKLRRQKPCFQCSPEV